MFYSKAGFDTIKVLIGKWSGMHRHNILEHTYAVVQICYIFAHIDIFKHRTLKP